MNREDLTKAIARLHEEQASDASVDNVFKVIKRLVELDEKVYAASDWTPEGQLMFESIQIIPKNGYYFIMYTDPKFYQGRFSKEITRINLQGFLDVYFGMLEQNTCQGIVINPATNMEMILDAKYIDQIIEKEEYE